MTCPRPTRKWENLNLKSVLLVRICTEKSLEKTCPNIISVCFWIDHVSVNLNPKDGPTLLPNPQTANPSSLHFIQPLCTPPTLQFRILGPNSEQCLAGGPTACVLPITSLWGKEGILLLCLSWFIFLCNLSGAHAHSHSHHDPPWETLLFFCGPEVGGCK